MTPDLTARIQRPALYLLPEEHRAVFAGFADDHIDVPLGIKEMDSKDRDRASPSSKRGRRIEPAPALDHVPGFMTTDDVSCTTFGIAAQSCQRSARINSAEGATTITLRWDRFSSHSCESRTTWTCSSASPSTAR